MHIFLNTLFVIAIISIHLITCVALYDTGKIVGESRVMYQAVDLGYMQYHKDTGELVWVNYEDIPVKE